MAGEDAQVKPWDIATGQELLSVGRISISTITVILWRAKADHRR
jgi:hypothetical protein